MTQIPFSELLTGWSLEWCSLVGLFAFTILAMTVIARITAPVPPRREPPKRQRRLSRDTSLLGDLR